jgi:hypothetical protein
MYGQIWLKSTQIIAEKKPYISSEGKQLTIFQKTVLGMAIRKFQSQKYNQQKYTDAPKDTSVAALFISPQTVNNPVSTKS